MNFDIKHSWSAPQTFRAQSITGTYTLLDVKLEKQIRGSLPIETLPWQIGVIVGSSGSGKTSIAKNLFPQAYIKGFDYSQDCFPDDFPEELSINEIDKALCSVGFAEPPSWLKSYGVLSQGQKMRVDISRALLLDVPLIVFDEFTSVVDRQVAKIGSYAISKNVRHQKGKQFIAVTCHEDVLDWLEPDWTYCVVTNVFTDYTETLQPGVTEFGTIIDVKKNDVTPKLYSLSSNVIYPCGKCFGSITI